MRRLRPRGVGEILDGGFDVLRHRPATVLSLTAIVVLPLYALPTLLNFGRISSVTDTLGSETPQNPFTVAFGGGTGTDPVLGWLSTGGSWLALAIVGVGIGALVSAWMMGSDPSLGMILRITLRRLPVLFVAWLAALPIKFLGFVVCLIGVLIPVSLLMVMSPVIATEPVGPFAAIARSWRLSSRRLFPMMVVVIGGAFVSIAVSLILTLVGILVLSIWQSASWVWIALGVVDVLIALLLVPLRAAWAALAYVDLRVRTEGLDIELESTELFGPS